MLSASQSSLVAAVWRRAAVTGELEVYGCARSAFELDEQGLVVRVPAELVSAEVVLAIFSELAAAGLPPLASVSFCHLEPAITGALLVPLVLPLLSVATEGVNFDTQPMRTEDARAIAAALVASGRAGGVSLSLIRCGVARSDVVAGLPSGAVERLIIFMAEE